jgi:hypothetical protein
MKSRILIKIKKLPNSLGGVGGDTSKKKVENTQIKIHGAIY